MDELSELWAETIGIRIEAARTEQMIYGVASDRVAPSRPEGGS